MGIYLKLGLRNIFRNARRSAITLAAMAFGATAIILFGGFVHFMFWGVRENAIHSELGHIQLYQRGFSEKGNIEPFEYLITDVPRIMALLESVDHVRLVTPRLRLSGLISTGETTTSFFGLGVDPDKEADLSSFVNIVDGQDLSQRQANGAILGKGLAAGIGAKPGDSLTILSTTRHGSINAAEVIVRGINGVRMPDQFRRYVLAIQDFNKVLELKAQDPAMVSDEPMPMVYLHLGLAYKKNNQKAEARATWERGRQLYPQAKEAALIEKELHDL